MMDRFFPVIPAKAGIQARNARAPRLRLPTSPSFQRTLEPILILTFSTASRCVGSKEESPAKLPITYGARVTFLCSHKEK